MFEKKSSYNYEEILSSSKGNLFPGDMGLPRLPLPPILMFDRFTLLTEEGGKFNKGMMKAELDIRPDLWFFKCHFLDDPVMPGCLGVDAFWQMLGFYLGWSGNSGFGRALGAGEIKFFGQVLPTAKLVEYQIDIKRIMRRGLILGVADAELRVDGKLIYTAASLKVGLFQKGDFFNSEG